MAVLLFRTCSFGAIPDATLQAATAAMLGRSALLRLSGISAPAVLRRSVRAARSATSAGALEQKRFWANAAAPRAPGQENKRVFLSGGEGSGARGMASSSEGDPPDLEVLSLGFVVWGFVVFRYSVGGSRSRSRIADVEVASFAGEMSSHSSNLADSLVWTRVGKLHLDPHAALERQRKQVQGQNLASDSGASP